VGCSAANTTTTRPAKPGTSPADEFLPDPDTDTDGIADNTAVNHPDPPSPDQPLPTPPQPLGDDDIDHDELNRLWLNAAHAS
jgi:hypothetical protein